MAEMSIVTRTLPGVDPTLRSRLVLGLNRNLATLIDMAGAYKQAHWNVVGIDFAQLHALFDKFHAEILGHVDLVAERITALGGLPRGTVHVVVEQSALPSFPLEERQGAALVEELLARLDTLDGDLRQAMEESAAEAVTQDLYIDIVRAIEMQRWMLQAHLAGAGKPAGELARHG